MADRLALIALGQAAGFSLNEVGAMLVDLQVDQQMLIAKAAEHGERSLTFMYGERFGISRANEGHAANHFITAATRTLKDRLSQYPSTLLSDLSSKVCRCDR
ncbi:hypothetical protein D9M71_612820 [compost metagenome]